MKVGAQERLSDGGKDRGNRQEKKMPIYEYFCSECNLRFELLRPSSEANQVTACPHCQNTAEQIPSSFSQHKTKTYLDKLNERKAEVEWRADRRMEEDPLLRPENWLEHVKEEKERGRKLNKKIERTFGKEPDAPLKYAAALETERRRREEDHWVAD